ncbi:glutamate--tRNA ligase [Acidithiobacillus caldus]|uniref:glutamate--tRNA ligase n=1 Tax=Acidithiobacillus caldus TaxID=33059 RepID=UPI001D0184A4|nr:glutamate--tRNA ligase [Acidithiobacillus caldus]
MFLPWCNCLLALERVAEDPPAAYDTTMIQKSRFAPSPTGYLHLGNARTALFAWLAARHDGGHFLLRIEDTDRERSPQQYEDALLEDLRWLGLDWDEGPDCGGDFGPYRQMERLGIYGELYQRLLDAHLAYPCYCTPEMLAAEREAQRAAGRAPRYSGRCRELDAAARAELEALGRQPSLRFRVASTGRLRVDDLIWGEREYSLEDLGDFVIRRSDGSPAFFFANAVDDALMGVDLVLRGEDHLSNTPRQILILQALGMKAPTYGHLPLLLGSDGQPLSKRHGAASLRDLRAEGFLPEAVRNYLARLGHHYGEADGRLLTDEELRREFRLDAIGRAPAHFDLAQLEHWQAQAVQSSTTEQLAQWLAPVLDESLSPAERLAFVELIRPNIRFPAQARDWWQRFVRDPEPDEEALDVLRETPEAFWMVAAATFEAENGDWKGWIAALQEASGRRGRALFQPLRAALTGRLHGPELAGWCRLLGAERCRQRLSQAGRRARVAV